MEMMLEYVLHSSLCDIERFSVLIDKIVANGSVENYPKYQVTLAEMRAKVLSTCCHGHLVCAGVGYDE